MGLCRSRRREEYELPEDFEESHFGSSEESLSTEERWRVLTTHAQRLAFKRRQWAYLGHHLRDIRARGRR